MAKEKKKKNKAKPLPKVKTEPRQCANCGKILTSDSVLIDKENTVFICGDCYRGYRRYLLERDLLQKDGNIALLKALDKGTAVEYKNLTEFVDILAPCYTKGIGGKS